MYSGKIAVPPGGGGLSCVQNYLQWISHDKNKISININRSLINVGFADLKGKQLNTSFSSCTVLAQSEYKKRRL
jgi:hypothetical protein